MQCKKVGSCHMKSDKSMSVSSFSDSGSHCSNKTHWKCIIPENGSLFYAKYTPKDGNYTCSTKKTEPLSALKLASVKKENIKELVLIVSSVDRYRFGRRSSVIESMLGFGVVPFVDNVECLMVANIIDNSILLEYPHIKEGDWFMSLDNIEVRTGNINKLLLQYTIATKVKLTFRGACGASSQKEELSLREINNFDDFALTYKRLFKNNMLQDKIPIFLALIVGPEYFNIQNTECMFYYPYITSNFLYKAKGSFLTLDSVINNELNSLTIQSTITVDSTKYYVSFGHVNRNFVLCAFSSSSQSKKAAKSIGIDFMDFLKFNISEFRSLEVRHYLTHICDILKINVENNVNNGMYNLDLGACLGTSCVSLPKEAQLRVCDALSELESMDFKNWNESQATSRDFIVCGTALYYDKHLMASNLPVDLRKYVECFLRLRGITEFLLSESVNEMYIWEKIEQLDTENKHFMAICTHNHLLLVVVLKSMLFSKSDISCIMYLEEITQTIDYLLSCGIGFISQFWIGLCKRPSLNLERTEVQGKYKFSFMHQKDISSEITDNNNARSDSPPLSLSQSEEGGKKKSELEFDWETFGNKNEFGELDYNSHYIEPILNEVKNIIPFNLTTGWSNDLKFFFCLNFADAVIMQPLKILCSDLQLGVIKEYILLIHEILQINLNLKKLQDTTLSLNKNVTVVKEHSISVELVNSLGGKEIIIIIGRLFSFPLREVYVCFGQNFSQNLVELSFRMSFLNIG